MVKGRTVSIQKDSVNGNVDTLSALNVVTLHWDLCGEDMLSPTCKQSFASLFANGVLDICYYYVRPRVAAPVVLFFFLSLPICKSERSSRYIFIFLFHFSQIYRGESNECHISNLLPDQVYQFRVQAVRTVDEQAFQTPTPSPGTSKQIKGVSQVTVHNNKEIKGIYSPVVRVKTLSKASVQPATDDEAENDEELAEDSRSSLSDTQLTLIILGSFLAICILTVVLLRGMINEY